VKPVVAVAAALLCALALPLPAAVGDGLAVDAVRADCDPGTYRYETVVPPALDMMQINKAWEHGKGAGVTVAVVDSGIDGNNQHLRQAIAGGVNLVPDGLDPLGRIDQFGHGTAIAGQIAARAYEGSGVIGVAPEAMLLSVRVFANRSDEAIEAGWGPSAARLAEGIRWAADNGADIINVSISDYADQPELLDAANYATASGSLVVASAGNRGTTAFTENSIRYPAGYPGVLGVTATNHLGVVTSDSIHGPQVAVAAPGVNVVTSAVGAGDCIYATEEASSSYATGYASGAAALVVEAHPTETPAQWKYRLEASARRANLDARDDVAGWGVIQPYDAITLVPSASTRGPESPFADTSKSQLGTPEVSVDPQPSNSPLAQTRQIMLVVAVIAVSVLGIFGVIVVLRRVRRAEKSRV